MQRSQIPAETVEVREISPVDGMEAACGKKDL